MHLAAFALPLPSLHPQPNSARRSTSPLHAKATLSLPADSPISRPPPPARPFHSEETKRKIGASVLRRAAVRRHRVHRFALAMLDDADDAQSPAADGSAAPPKRRRRRAAMSAESRAKISAALKGRAKTDAHRASLRARFEGESNPMYGRKLSPETRAKISRAMSVRAKERRRAAEEAAREAGVEDRGVELKMAKKEVIEDLRNKAVGSRLLGGKGEDGGGERALEDAAEAEEMDAILMRVARLDAPPENVVKTRANTRRRRDKQEETAGEVAIKGDARKCAACAASGYVPCPGCAAAFGVASAKCEVCFGAGAVFCERCQGVGEVGVTGKQ